MAVESATSQSDLPSLTPLSLAGCGRLQLGVPQWATSVDCDKLLIINPAFCGSRFSTGRLLAIEDSAFTFINKVKVVVNEMKPGKVPGLDGFPVVCSNKGGMTVLEWLVKLLNISYIIGVVPMDWYDICIEPL